MAVKAADTATVVPLSVIEESPIVPEPVNLASAFVVPPGVVTPPPAPAQLPVLIQIVVVEEPGSGNV